MSHSGHDFIENNKNGVVYMTSPNITAIHAFTTRLGGVSTGIYSSLNLGLRRGDDPAGTEENYSRLCAALGISRDDIVCSNQIHSAHIRLVSSDDRENLFNMSDGHTEEQADGLVTRDGGTALMVFTADCVPVLLHDPVKGAIGAVHAGWRGTVKDIAGAAVRKMADEFGCAPHDIRAAIGPCISVCCYETGEDVADAVRDILGTASRECIRECVNTNAGRYLIDLKECNRLLLERAGVRDISVSGECTYCSNEKYWSHRFTGGKRGSQAALIATARPQ